MREIVLFVEDFAHRQVVGALVRKLAAARSVDVKLDWRNAIRGHGAVASEFKDFLRDLRRQGSPSPDLVIVATDANCTGPTERAREFQPDASPVPILLAIPDPHIERWLLVDGAAFKAVLGRGCDAPDQKCDRDRYKQLLVRSILNTGKEPSIGGIEYADAIVDNMDLDRAKRSDAALKKFIDGLESVLTGWERG